ncbi:hypothetical protein [Reinekea sp. G2M2-21]|uniref:hypothetical protein n=1 Tax=Reinekea sp. G2M2-21 TaxID=2788942 RepID=UPI0018A931B1|nr:hypothetical protein [Reinekea sp. G2M2-21]
MMTQVNLEEVKALFTPLSESRLIELWPRLHAGDCEPLPQTPQLTAAWLLFHNGDFQRCAEVANALPDGQSLRLKALATYAHYLETDSDQKVALFKEIASISEQIVKNDPSQFNAYYQIAYNLGRYGQFISVTKALAEGIAGKIQTALTACLRLAPEHADAHTAQGTYAAEIIGKLGKLAAKLTYAVSADEAIEHYRKAVKLAPFSISAKTEYADGIIALHGKKQLKQAVAMYQEAVANPPADALEALDYYIAQRELAEA